MGKSIYNNDEFFRNRKPIIKTISRTITKGNKEKKISTRINLERLGKNISRKKDYLQKVYRVTKKINFAKSDGRNHRKKGLVEKVCEKCMNLHADNLLLLCDICNDGYHIYCLVITVFIYIYMFIL